MKNNQSLWGLRVLHRNRLSVHSLTAFILLNPIGIAGYVYLAIYAAHYDFGNIQRTIQSACASLNGFFRSVGLSISEAKSELVCSLENTPIYRSMCLLTVVLCLWCPILGTLGLCLMGNYYRGHTCATSSRNVSRELKFCDPSRWGAIRM
jgi:hypothetical protein